MSYLYLLKARIEENGVPGELSKLTEPGFASFDSGHPGRFSQDEKDLAPDLREGLRRLSAAAVPPIATRDVWEVVVADALWLAESGSAMQALRLGWDARELFGVSSEPAWQSLAVWMGGRRLVLIDERSAIAAEGDHRYVFTRRGCESAVMLWEISGGLKSGDRRCR